MKGAFWAYNTQTRARARTAAENIKGDLLIRVSDCRFLLLLSLSPLAAAFVDAIAMDYC